MPNDVARQLARARVDASQSREEVEEEEEERAASRRLTKNNGLLVAAGLSKARGA